MELGVQGRGWVGLLYGGGKQKGGAAKNRTAIGVTFVMKGDDYCARASTCDIWLSKVDLSAAMVSIADSVKHLTVAEFCERGQIRMTDHAAEGVSRHVSRYTCRL